MKKVGLTTRELALYYQDKRLEFEGATQEVRLAAQTTFNGTLLDEMNKLIDAVNSKEKSLEQ